MYYKGMLVNNFLDESVNGPRLHELRGRLCITVSVYQGTLVINNYQDKSACRPRFYKQRVGCVLSR